MLDGVYWSYSKFNKNNRHDLTWDGEEIKVEYCC